MAVDEALLSSATRGGGCVFRLYGWAPATLSLGYFQPHAARAEHAPSACCPLVRRASGGGAIVHDREWTYSLVVPPGHPLARWPAALYDVVHRALIQALAQAGAAAEVCQGSRRRRLSAEPFLCFLRRAKGDVLLGAHKIAGSAQRRRQGAILQHGSILLSASPAAPELPGILDLAPQVHVEELRQRWLALLAINLQWRLAPSTLSPEEYASAESFRAARYDHSAWNLLR